MSYLITQTLLGAWLYIHNCHEGGEEKAIEDFERALRREPSEQTEAMLRGIEFEDAVLKYTCGGETDDATIAEVGDIVKGGQWQVTAYKEKTIAGIDFLLMAKADVVKAGIIHDIKRSDSYEKGKYLNSPQHPMYMEVIDSAFGFQYDISDGNDVFTEYYSRANTPKIEPIIEQFVSFLRSYEYLEVYKEKWAAA